MKKSKTNTEAKKSFAQQIKDLEKDRGQKNFTKWRGDGLDLTPMEQEIIRTGKVPATPALDKAIERDRNKRNKRELERNMTDNCPHKECNAPLKGNMLRWNFCPMCGNRVDFAEPKDGVF